MSSYSILQLETEQMCQLSFYHEAYTEIFLNVNIKPEIQKHNILYTNIASKPFKSVL